MCTLPAPHLRAACTCACLHLHLHLHLGLPARQSRLPQEPNDRPTSFPERAPLHCLPVHSRLQHCIFPDPHLSLPSASSSGNGNASARGRRNAFLLSVSALLSLPLTHSLSPLLCRTGTSRLACILHSVCTLHSVMPCRALPRLAASIYTTQHSTRIRAHTYMRTYVHRPCALIRSPRPVLSHPGRA